MCSTDLCLNAFRGWKEGDFSPAVADPKLRMKELTTNRMNSELLKANSRHLGGLLAIACIRFFFSYHAHLVVYLYLAPRCTGQKSITHGLRT